MMASDRAGALAAPLRYLARLTPGKATLWCYLLWYASTVAHHLDASPGLWLNAAGLSLLIGIALTLSVGGSLRLSRHPWQTFRLFLTPFCVSSFSALIKDKDFFLILPPSPDERLHSAGLCLAFLGLCVVLRAVFRLADMRAARTGHEASRPSRQ